VQRIQYRQLLDLLGSSPADARGDQLDAGYVRMGELAAVISIEDRVRAIGDAGLRLRSPRLVAALAAGEPQVAAAALQNAQLSGDAWLDLIPALPPAARPHLRQRRDLTPETTALLIRLGVNDRGLPPADAVAEVLRNEPEQLEDSAIVPPQQATGEGGIGAIVRRIEAYRRAKQVIDHVPVNDSPRLPLGEEHVLQVPERVRAFNFAADAAGRITWSDPGVAPMVTGLAMSGTNPDSDLAVLTRRHQPLRSKPVRLAGAEAIAGSWQVDAAPWFDPLTGRYLGYRGRMRRPSEREPLVMPVADSQADRIRQMLHELRTPVNAIQGFAEVIQQQLFGPTPHEYRALAAGIAGDAARMLSAFEELERLARLESGAMELDRGEIDLAAVVAATVNQLGVNTAPRGSGFALKIKDQPLPVGLDRLEVERIVWRLLATLAGVSAPGEVLKATLREARGGVRLDLALPATLVAREGESLFEAAAGAIPQTISAGVFGVGFALRLARAEARAAGGDLIRKEDKLRLILPGLTGDAADHTQAG
jgi:signal transduction histidine kinase